MFEGFGRGFVRDGGVGSWRWMGRGVDEVLMGGFGVFFGS